MPFLVDLPVLLGELGIKGAESLVKWEEKLGAAKKGCVNLGKACKALFDQTKQDWEDLGAYRERMKAVRELTKRQDLFRRAFDAENYHLEQDKQGGYWTAEILQLVCGAQVVEALAKCTIKGAQWASKGGKVAKRVQQGVKVEEGVVEGAKLSTNSAKLQKQLASEMQMSSKGEAIIRFPKLQASRRLVEQYGGEPKDWVKKASESFITKYGLQFETHWYENLTTGHKVEFKTKLKT